MRRAFARGIPSILVLACSVIGWHGCATGPSRTSATGTTGQNTTGPRAAATEPPAGRPAGEGARFAEVSQTSGLNYRWEIPGKRPLNILQTIGNGCAFLDYDNDGNLDVLLVGPRLALYRGDGHGRFSDVTHQTGLDRLSGHFLGCAVGDYDNDGYDDLYISAYRGGVLLHNEPGLDKSRPHRAGGETPPLHTPSSRVFRDVTVQSGIPPQPWCTSCAFADVDGDGRLDLYIGNYVAFGPNTKPQLCAYGGQLSSCGPRFYTPEQGRLYHNEGGGRFKDVSAVDGIQAAPGRQIVSGKALGAAFANYDGSGRESLAIANDEMPGDLLHNEGRAFQNVGATSGVAYDSQGNVHGGMGLDWGDYDNDGKLDLAVATFQHEAKCIYRNEGGGLFSESSAALGIADKTMPYVAFGMKWLDYDNDGWLDLVLTNGHVQDNIAAVDKSTTYRQAAQLFHNERGQSFVDVSGPAGEAFQRMIVGRGLAVGDYDNDGRMDVLIVDSEGTPLLLHNETPGVGHWLGVTLIGAKSNRTGIGALITVEAGSLKQVRRCGTDGSYMSASDRRVHAGLGSATTANLSVRWPSGHIDVYKGVTADRVVTLREGSSTLQ